MKDSSDDLQGRAREAKRNGSLREAQAHLTAAVAVLRQEGTRRDLAIALRELGEVARALPDGAGARDRYEEAVALLRGLDEPLRLAHTVRHLGDVHHDRGEPALAEPCYVEALAIYRRHPEADPLDFANALRSLAVLREEGGAREEAVRLWSEAHDLYVALGVAAGAEESAARRARLIQL